MTLKFRSLGVAMAVILLRVAAPVEGASLDVNQTNLVTDNQAVNAAQITDPNLVNPWGMSFAPGGPFWVSDNGTGLSTLYTVNSSGVSIAPLVVTIPPGAGLSSPTGQVFNTASASGAFNGDNFLFVSEDGTISGWRGALGTTAETLVAGAAPNVYKGVTEATIAGNTYLFAANFGNDSIDVLKGTAATPNFSGTFSDPTIPAGFAPFNIQFIGGKFYVTYALQDAAHHDDVAGASNGFVNVFDTNGNLISRVASQGTLNSPWGLAIAPASFGSLSGDLLVGNFGDGRINAFNLSTNTFDGQLMTPSGQPLSIHGLWALSVGGGGGSNGDPSILYFTAGPNRESDGLLGALSVPEPSSVVHSALAMLIGLLVYGRKRLALTLIRA